MSEPPPCTRSSERSDGRKLDALQETANTLLQEMHVRGCCVEGMLDSAAEVIPDVPTDSPGPIWGGEREARESIRDQHPSHVHRDKKPIVLAIMSDLVGSCSGDTTRIQHQPAAMGMARGGGECVWW